VGPAARVGDPVEHPIPDVLDPGPGSPNVFIGGQPAWRGVGGAQAAQFQSAASNSSQMIQDLQKSHNVTGEPDQATLDNIKQKQLDLMSAQINNLPAGVDVHFCDVLEPPPVPHGPGVITDGSKTVMINGLPACRQGDTVTEAIGGQNKVLEGCPTVTIGD
jgi:uncharacterized Zn-binding protein involved in type VI secretion